MGKSDLIFNNIRYSKSQQFLTARLSNYSNTDTAEN